MTSVYEKEVLAWVGTVGAGCGSVVFETSTGFQRLWYRMGIEALLVAIAEEDTVSWAERVSCEEV